VKCWRCRTTHCTVQKRWWMKTNTNTEMMCKLQY